MEFKNLNYICQSIHPLFDINLSLLNMNKEVIFEYGQLAENPLSPINEMLFDLAMEEEDPVNFPVYRSTELFEHFFTIIIQRKNEEKHLLIVGPTVNSTITNDMLKPLLNDSSNKFKNLQKEALLNYYNSLPVFSNLKFHQLMAHLYYMIYQKNLDPYKIIENDRSLKITVLTQEEPYISISSRRQNLSFHHPLIFEQTLLQHITRGRKEDFLKNWKLINQDNHFGILAKSHLRHKKNLAISGITLATRAAIDGGLPYETAYTLSDLYIQNIEDIKDSRSVESYMITAMSDFAERVRKERQIKHSKPINNCLNYIFNHLYEEINLTSLGELNDMHPNYLSSLFKKEVGISLSEYIQRSKIEEAKSLLQFSDFSISKISTLLNFHDQSYFTKTFKKYTGVTPKSFQNFQLKK
ncbi:helix-turn-helix domain-containing protein [Niallia sp. JL1B1071]|uniref:helix-turn-helix domain-containing protein n=1 Tax=Niallia tiangongensis TaxID=3237105 RepID=UPI0037DDBBF4